MLAGLPKGEANSLIFSKRVPHGPSLQFGRRETRIGYRAFLISARQGQGLLRFQAIFAKIQFHTRPQQGPPEHP